MKKLFTAIAITAFTFVGTSIQAEAGGGYRKASYTQPSSTIYISGYRHGRPVYTQKYFIGYDRCGTPRWGYRTVSAPSHNQRGNSFGGGHNDRRHGNHGYDNRRSSGSGVHFRFGR